MDHDRNLLFGVLALQADAITSTQFIEGCALWASHKGTSLADLMLQRGWINPADRADVERLIERKLKRHGGDVHASLAAAAANEEVRNVLENVPDPDVRQTLAGPPPDGGHVLISTIAYQPESRERYTLTRLHAKGGLGQVWLARDADLGRHVALKELRPEQANNPAVWSRFLEEARITGQLEHPCIVPVYELSKRSEDQKPFYTMRFVKGRTLTEAARAYHEKRRQGEAGALDLPGLLNAFVGVCNAIGYAHSRGVIHRDLKGQNVVLGDFGEVMVLDWGLAKLVGRDEDSDAASVVLDREDGHNPTLQGQTLGTPAYMAPEQAEGRHDQVDRRSDIYGLGAILYEILTGQAPFTGHDTTEVLRRVREDPPTRPRQLNPEAPAGLEAVCLKALAKRPDDRYETAGDLADEVRHWLADEPVRAFCEPFSKRAGRWARRHKPVVAGAAALLVTATIALGVSTLLVNRERARAEESFRQARAAVDDYFTAVSESKLLDVPGLQPLRKELLESARNYYEGFLRQRGDDPSVRVEAASSSFRVGWVSLAIGERERAMGPFRAATALYEELARAHPGDVEYRRLSATGHGAQGLLLAGLDRKDESMAEHRKALEIRRAIAAANPGDVLARIDVARTHRNIGDLHRGAGKPAEALAEWDEAAAIARPLLDRPLRRAAGRVDLTGRNDLSAIVREDLGSILLDRAETLRESGRHAEARASWERGRDLFEVLVRERPNDLSLKARLADCYFNGHSLEYDLGRFEEALRHILRSLELREAMAAANPSVSLYRRALAEGLLNLAYLQNSLHREAEALETYRREAELAEALLAVEPTSAYTKNLLSQGLGQRANILTRAGRANEALPLARRAAAILEPIVRDQPGAIFHASSLSNVLRSLGRAEAVVGNAAAALRAYERAGDLDRSLADRYPGCRYNLACSLALLVTVARGDRREPLALQAVDALRKALAAGYANVENIRIDPDLDVLRDRQDFRSLLTEPATKAAAVE